jgi:nucleoid-associated protein YgaU
MRVDRVTPTGEVVSRVETPVAKESAEVLAKIAPAAQTITVQPGFTLWRIASDRYGSGIEYVKVFSANQDKIKNPDLIYPGQVFSLPQ